ncbi:MAG: Flp family type IVb pilin [Chloroflexi bacterium]|nr:MAG: Flp family type IVb pilin [Chloroflexota bacterium]
MLNLALSNYLRLLNSLEREEGQDLVEYALLLGLIALVCVVAIGLAGDEVNRIWTEISQRLAAIVVP